MNRLGYSQDPEAYCGTCAGEGERPDVAGKLDVCMACCGQGFTGYSLAPAPRTPVPSLYQPGDELLEMF